MGKKAFEVSLTPSPSWIVIFIILRPRGGGVGDLRQVAVYGVTTGSFRVHVNKMSYVWQPYYLVSFHLEASYLQQFWFEPLSTNQVNEN